MGDGGDGRVKDLDLLARGWGGGAEGLDGLSHPWVAADLEGGGPSIWIGIQHAGDQALSFGGHPQPRRGVQIDVGLLDRAEYIEVGWSCEGKETAEEAVEDDAHGPHVGFLVVRITDHDFGGHVERAASHFVQKGTVGERDGKAKVGELDLNRLVGQRRFADENILKLDISVDDARPMAMIHGRGKLPKRGTCVKLRKPATLDDLVEQLSTTCELHHDMDSCGVVVDATQSYDGGMARQTSHDLDFTKSIRAFSVRTDSGMEYGFASHGFSVCVGQKDASTNHAIVSPP